MSTRFSLAGRLLFTSLGRHRRRKRALFRPHAAGSSGPTHMRVARGAQGGASIGSKGAGAAGDFLLDHVVRALLGRLAVVREIAGAIDQRKVREGLRKITDLAAAARIVLLAQEPDIVAQR